MMGYTKSKKAHLKLMPWIIWAIGSLYFFFDYINQVAPSAMDTELISSFHINAAMLGTIAAVYFYSYAIMQIPIGIIDDHFGPHRPLTIAAIIAGIGCLLFSFAKTPSTAIMARLLIGIGAGFSFVSVLKLISNWFPSKYFATLVGFTNIIGMIGAISGVGPLQSVTTKFGWQNTMLILAGVGGGLAIIIYFVVRDFPSGTTTWSAKKSTSKRSLKKVVNDIRHIFGSGQFWLIGIRAATNNTTFTALGALWGTMYIMQSQNITKTQAGTLASMIFVGAIPGSIFWGWISDKIKKRKPLMLFSSLASAIIFGVQLYCNSIPLTVTYILLLLLGFFASGNVLAYAVAHDIRPPGSAGIALGFVNTFLIGGSALFQPLIGSLLDSHSKQISAVSTKFSLPDFRFALSSIIIALIISFVATLFIKETHCRSIYAEDK